MSAINFLEIVQPFKEMVAYESLWLQDKMSFKKIAEYFSERPNVLPSGLAEHLDNKTTQYLLLNILKESVFTPNVMIYGTYDYPEKLRDAKHPIELLYYKGNIGYLNAPKSVAVVGSRKPSPEGIIRARKLAKMLVDNDIVVFSGLAEGIDTIAHTTTIKEGGRTVAVIGTPLNEYYPKQNKPLQDYISQNHLLVSQIPFLKYSIQDYRFNRGFFPERNKTMSALSDATVIVEASETSGTLIQAKAALDQGRKLFILQNCFENKNISWPERFEREGAIRIKTFDDILINLE